MSRGSRVMIQAQTVATAAEAAAGPPDAELVKAALAGSHGAFGELVDRHKVAVSSLVFAMTGRLGPSEEIAHETFVIAWERLAELDQRDRFRSWLYGIARNLVRRRRHDLGVIPARFALGAEVDVPCSAPSPLDRMISREDELVLQRELARIPKTYRVPLVLFYRKGKSVEKVAAALDLPKDAVKQRLSRGRKMLQQNI